MKVKVVTRWYNEEFFAPFFLNHYQWADEIIVLLEDTSTDNTAQIVRSYPNATLEYCHTDDKLNDRLLSDICSRKAASLDCDWVVKADADEYVFAPNFEDPKRLLSRANGNLIDTWFYWVYRHESERALDPSLPTIPQRRHGGNYIIWPGMGNKYKKPSIVKPEVGLKWYPGDQRYYPNRKVIPSSTIFLGVHWQMADVEEAVKRNEKNNNRLSDENKRNRWGTKGFTEAMIREECNKHLKDPLIF